MARSLTYGSRKKWISAIGLAAFLAFLPQDGHCGSLGYADGFNVFAIASVCSASDIGGRVAAGTTVDGTFDVGTQLTSTPTHLDLVTGVGMENGAQIKVNSAGMAFVPNGVAGGNILMNGGGSLVTSGALSILQRQPPTSISYLKDWPHWMRQVSSVTEQYKHRTRV